MGRPKKQALSETQKMAKKIGTDGEDVLRELEAMDVVGLNKRIAQANQAIAETKAELDANEKYTEVKNQVKAMSSGFREVKGRQNAIIAVSVKLRQEKGES
jgi:uncharacterized small protein (DUF1192 family)